MYSPDISYQYFKFCLIFIFNHGFLGVALVCAQLSDQPMIRQSSNFILLRLSLSICRLVCRLESTSKVQAILIFASGFTLPLISWVFLVHTCCFLVSQVQVMKDLSRSSMIVSLAVYLKFLNSLPLTSSRTPICFLLGLLLSVTVLLGVDFCFSLEVNSPFSVSKAAVFQSQSHLNNSSVLLKRNKRLINLVC